MGVCPNSGLGHLRLESVFLICSAFWIVVKEYGGRKMKRKELESNEI